MGVRICVLPKECTDQEILQYAERLESYGTSLKVFKFQENKLTKIKEGEESTIFVTLNKIKSDISTKEKYLANGDAHALERAIISEIKDLKMV